MCLYVCVSVCLSVRSSVLTSVFYFLLDHWRNRNETFRGSRHQLFDGYYILKTYCYVIFKVICEKPVCRLLLVAHIYTGTGDTLTYLLPPSYLPPTFYLPPTSNIPFKLLPPCQPSISLSTSDLPFYHLLPTSLSSFYLLFFTSYLPFYLLPPTSLSTSYLPPISYLPF